MRAAAAWVVLPLLASAFAWPAQVAGQDALPPEPAWRIATLITDATAQPLTPFRAFQAQNLQWVDVDGNGRPEILTGNGNGRLYLLDPEGPILAEVLWLAGPRFDPAQGTQPGIPVADLDRDGRRELYVVSNDGWATAYEHDPAMGLGHRIGLAAQWVRCLRCWDGEHDGTPWAGQGVMVTQHDDTPGQWALRADGSVAWEGQAFDGNAGVVLADLDADGRLEAVFGTDGGLVVARDARSGEVRWTFDTREALGSDPGSITFQATVADLDGDGRLEVAAPSRHAPERGEARGRLFVLEADGSLRWRTILPRGNPMAHSHPVPLDVSGDGVLDLLWLDWNTRGHHPGAFERLGPANLVALDGRGGAVLWAARVDTRWSNLDLAVADADGDGAQEVLVPQQRGGWDGLSLYSLQGREEAWWPVPPGWTLARGAVAVPWNGTMHLVLSLALPLRAEGTQDPSGTSPTGALLLVDTGQVYSAAWPGTYTFSTEG